MAELSWVMLLSPQETASLVLSKRNEIHPPTPLTLTNQQVTSCLLNPFGLWGQTVSWRPEAVQHYTLVFAQMKQHVTQKALDVGFVQSQATYYKSYC